MKYHNYVAVVGRVCGDDEDSLFTYENVTRQQAITTFIADMRELDGDDEAEVFVNHIVASNSPIETL